MHGLVSSRVDIRSVEFGHSKHRPISHHFFHDESRKFQTTNHTIISCWFEIDPRVSMDWFKGKSTGNHGFYHQIYGFPVNFPVIQFCECHKKSALTNREIVRSTFASRFFAVGLHDTFPER